MDHQALSRIRDCTLMAAALSGAVGGAWFTGAGAGITGFYAGAAEPLPTLPARMERI